MRQKVIATFLMSTFFLFCSFTIYQVYFSSSQNTVVKNKSSEKVTSSSSSTSNSTSSSTDETNNLPNVSTKDWDLVLVNYDHPYTEVPKLATLDNGYLVDERILSDYESMKNAAAANGVYLTVISAYRSVEDQTTVYNQDIAEKMATGLNEKDAKKETEKYVTRPTTSEHHTGLAMDILDEEWYNQSGGGLTGSFGDTPGGIWIAEHCTDYGFVVRYPEGKEDITHINYEPWHLRYVGQENAKYMTENNLVLEEYIELLQKAGK